MEFRIETKEAFRIIGYALSTTNQKKQGQKAIPSHWQRYEQQLNELLTFSNHSYPGILGINVYNIDIHDNRKFKYYIGVPSEKTVSEGMEEYLVPKMTWAVFSCAKQDIGKTEAMAITKWLPKSKYRALNKGYLFGKMKSEAPDIECYKEDETAEVWIAVKEIT